MRRLYRLPDDPDQLVVQRVQVRFVAQAGRERFQGLSGVVLAAVEAPVYEGLDASPQWVKQCCYHERGDDYGELRLLLLACERTEHELGRRHPAEIHQRQRRREGTVDQRTVDDEVYVVKAVAEDSYANSDRQTHQTHHAEHETAPLQPSHAGQIGDAAGEDGAADQYHYNVGEQLHLLALDPPRAAEAHRHRRYRPTAPTRKRASTAPNIGRSPPRPSM